MSIRQFLAVPAFRIDNARKLMICFGVSLLLLPARLTRHSSGRGLCLVVLRLASSAAPLNGVVRLTI